MFTQISNSPEIAAVFFVAKHLVDGEHWAHM